LTKSTSHAESAIGVLDFEEGERWQTLWDIYFLSRQDSFNASIVSGKMSCS